MNSSIIQLTVFGSKGDPYEVCFSRKENTMSTSCTCMSGKKKQHCHHRTKLLAGNVTQVMGTIPDDLTDQIAAMIDGTGLQSALQELKEADAQFKEAEDKLKRVKKKLDRVMHV